VSADVASSESGVEICLIAANSVLLQPGPEPALYWLKDGALPPVRRTNIAPYSHAVFA